MRAAARRLLAFGMLALLFAGPGRSRPARADEPAWQGHALGWAGIGTLLAPPGQPGLLYAAGLGLQGTVATDFFRSVDGGATWAARDIVSGTNDAGVDGLAVDPNAPRTLYAAVGLYGVRKSVDGGDTWTAQNAGLPAKYLYAEAIAVDPATPSTLYLSAGVDGLFKSTDGAATWHALATDPANSGEGGIVVDPRTPSVVYAASERGVWKSEDAGATWRQLPNAPLFARGLLIDPSDPRRLYVEGGGAIAVSGLWRSTDAGASWQRLVNAGTGAGAAALDPRAPRTLFAIVPCIQPCRTDLGGSASVRWSGDGGGTWAVLSSRTPNPYADALLIAGGSLWLGTSSGVWRLPIPASAAPTAAQPTPHDARYFAQTGFRVDDDAFWDFFTHRGGVATFGYPTSRTFTFQGFPVQFFQRQVMQQFPDGSVHLLNLLDPGLLPYTSFNFSTFPPPDPALTAQAPAVGSADYGDAVVAFVRQHAPDTWNGLPVRFAQTFLGTVSLQQVLPNPAGGIWQSPGILALVNLEIWGVPTSPPTYDPKNHGFVYLRWQRGVMMYDAACRCTQGVLLADYLKALLTGQNLPADLASEAAASPFLDQYDPAAPRWVRDPSRLPNTDLTNAFTPE